LLLTEGKIKGDEIQFPTKGTEKKFYPQELELHLKDQHPLGMCKNKNCI
jgi:hypothetical protein